MSTTEQQPSETAAVPQVPAASELVRQFAQWASVEGLDIVGPYGLLEQLAKRVLETGLEVGMTEHHTKVPSQRIVGIKDNRQVLFAVNEVAFAEAVGKTVWLRTDLGRYRSATDGIEKLDAQISGFGFIRVHRSYIVNLNRVREVTWKGGGELDIIMDGIDRMIPVSRRRAKFFAATLGL